jgi:hypothetical protein
MTTFLRIPLAKYNLPSGNTLPMDGPGYHYRGFMAFKPSHFSVDLLENWKVSLVTPDINQIKFNSLVKKSEIKHKPLRVILLTALLVSCTQRF